MAFGTKETKRKFPDGARLRSRLIQCPGGCGKEHRYENTLCSACRLKLAVGDAATAAEAGQGKEWALIDVSSAWEDHYFGDLKSMSSGTEWYQRASGTIVGLLRRMFPGREPVAVGYDSDPTPVRRQSNKPDERYDTLPDRDTGAFSGREDGSVLLSLDQHEALRSFLRIWGASLDEAYLKGHSAGTSLLVGLNEGKLRPEELEQKQTLVAVKMQRARDRIAGRKVKPKHEAQREQERIASSMEGGD